MRLNDQPAYVLHARAWRETSLLVEVLTQEHGRLGLLARGVQGPRKQALRAALQPLQCIRFDAVLASEDLLAVGALKYAGVRGRNVPKDLSVIGYNNSDACLCCDPELTSVDNRLKAVCAHCVSVLLDVLEGREAPQETVFSGELVFRQSTVSPSSTIEGSTVSSAAPSQKKEVNP